MKAKIRAELKEERALEKGMAAPAQEKNRVPEAVTQDRYQKVRRTL